MLDRRNHIFEQLDSFRERSADSVGFPLPVEMQSLVLKLASAEPQRSPDASPSDPAEQLKSTNTG